MKKKEDSRSDIQEEIELKIFEKVKERFPGIDLIKPESLPLNPEGTSFICPDFYSEEHKIIGEIHAHIGKLKGAQSDKIASDVLKMLLWEKHTKCYYQKYIVVCDEEEHKQLEGKSALAEAIRTFGVEVMRIDLDDEERKRLKDCMTRQNLINENKKN